MSKFIPLFGRREPKERPWEDKYSFNLLGIPTPINVETRTIIPAWKYEQIGNSCTGYSVVTSQTINNVRRLGSKPINRWFKYNGLWQYDQACRNDGVPATNLKSDIGTFLWASLWVANNLGLLRLKERNPRLNDGIQSYYWCRTVNEIRTAFSLGRIPVMGTNWHLNMLKPYRQNKEWWINTGGEVVGGHAYCLINASDKRQAFQIRNTWKGYPDVWISYVLVETLLMQGGECGVGLDR